MSPLSCYRSPTKEIQRKDIQFLLEQADQDKAALIGGTIARYRFCKLLASIRL